jgi:hypothetical protein
LIRGGSAASPAVSIALEQIQKEEHTEHCYYKDPVLIKLVQDMMQKLHYASSSVQQQHT